MSDKKGKTLWQMFVDNLKDEKEEPSEFKIFNPLKAKINDFVSIESDELAGANLLVSEIDAYKCRLGRVYESVDYILRDADKWVTLRINPIPDADPYSHKHSDVLVLSPDYEMAYDKNFHEVILPTGILEVRDAEGKVIATYQRLNGVKEPYSVEVTVLKDPEKPPETERLEYWDFIRETDKGIEYYFVELNLKTHWFQMFVGHEISEKDVTLLPANAD